MKQINYSRLREIIAYVFFGVLTTIVNIAVFYLLNTVLGWHYLWANLWAIILSIIFAYVTNKLWVFHSSRETPLEILREFFSFVLVRALSGLMDMLLMLLLITYLGVPDFTAKIIVQVIVIIINYIASKWLVFKQNELDF
ncbi:GtrA family protein [Aerococcus suis]|uniref:Flippase GtrA (Transmembrane translocase of bactoprenol-linked glucose) n=1 Tax=Aerococcus suis TaxID=371602 RepID=A0A1W1Y3U6_9LACT|nr:GtrA family protein [Aerococcus suis]MCI7239910.1 GtrA family protein [Aerococcus suis]MDD7758092.1 GtrA family protein [Aerococcus suis]MDY4646355.1 GtrA family protein [Aerococcus suis]SMC30835.1 Putative flippase GtrA (transmembrane translocase of bactoprenol-linked glucose) [Aerococcus suis]